MTTDSTEERTEVPDNQSTSARGSTLPDQDHATSRRTDATFVAAFTGIDHGAVSGEADSGLAELVQAVRETGRKGKVTVVLEVRPYKGNDINVEVAAAVTVALPKAEPRAGLFFVSGDGHLTRDDPRYDTLFDTDSDGSPVS
jgi:hypothetical protein